MISHPSQKLLAEEARYRALAAEAALQAILWPVFVDFEGARSLVKEHLLRAETFKAAAALLTPPPTNSIPFQPHVES